MNIRTCSKLFSFSLAAILSAASFNVDAQTSPKPGLWEISVTSARMTGLPPEAEAKIAALPPAQQAQVRAMMSGGAAAGGAKPMVTSVQTCMTANTNVDSMMSRLQQQQGGMQCTTSNKSQTAKGVSFDLSCTGQMGTAKGHMQYSLIDDRHMNSSTHLPVTGTGAPNAATATSTIDATSTGKFVSADCGTVRPFGPPAAQ